MSLLATALAALPLSDTQQALAAGALGLVFTAVVACWIAARVRLPSMGSREEVRVPPPL